MSKSIKQILEELEENLEKIFGDDTKLQGDEMVPPVCKICNMEIYWIPERNQPPIIRLWCGDCGEFTLYCQICLLMTDNPNHICHFQTTLY